MPDVASILNNAGATTPPDASQALAAAVQPPDLPSPSPYAMPGEHIYNTPLEPSQEQQFQQWVTQNKVPFDPALPLSDYDMRGFWQALMAGDERAKSAVDPNDNRLHYPDYWKTPYHKTFSNESQWANPQTAPHWNDKDQLVLPDGTVVFDDRAPKEDE